MKALQYAKRFVRFNSASPIQGQFDESRYPFIIRPIEALDDIEVKSEVLLKPAQSLGTVFLQIATAFRLDVLRKSVLAVAQTDSDAKNFATIKLNPFLQLIPTLVNTLRPGRYSQTLEHWLWANHELIISGPGENAQNSVSCCFLHTDEAHLWNVFYPMAFKALLDRMGPRYDRAALHVTTSADAGTDVDICFHESSQDEWHVRCLNCNFLFQPVWEQTAKLLYNGEKVFHYTESQSETETLDSLTMICPECDHVHKDSPIMRKEMDDGADYKSMNPDASPTMESFRYNAFAPRWRPHRDLLAIYLSACNAAKIGNLKPYENWIKKQLCLTWTGEYPMLGSSMTGRDYVMGETLPDPNKLRVMSVDRQEGKKGEGFHLWVLVEEFERDGGSKRLAYIKATSWTQAREIQIKWYVLSKHVGADYGKQVGRDVFAKCAEYGWYAMKSTDEIEFVHNIPTPGNRTMPVRRPYSENRAEDPMSGKGGEKPVFRGGSLPKGFCVSILWSKPTIYPILHQLKNGESKRYFGVASDFPQEYIDQLHSYIPRIEPDKKTNAVKKLLWVKVKQDDHAFVMSCQSLVLAIRAGFFPLNENEGNK